MQIPDDLVNIPEPRIVYTGVIYGRFDQKLFYEVVDSNPDKSFVIIGPIQDGMLEEKKGKYVFAWHEETFRAKKLFEIHADRHCALY